MEEQKKNKDLELRLQDLLSVLARCWWIMLIVTVVVFSGTFIYKKATHKDLYTGTSVVYVMKEPSSSGTTTGEVSIANTLLNDYMELISMDTVLEQVRYELGLNMSLSQLRSHIKLQKIEDTRFVYVKYTAETKQDAADIANALAAVSSRYMNETLLNNQPYTKVVDESAVPTSPSNPISKFKLLLVAVGAAILVYAVYLVLFLMDDKINSPEDVERYLELSTLGQIPYRNDSGRKKKYYTSFKSSLDKIGGAK